MEVTKRLLNIVKKTGEEIEKAAIKKPEKKKKVGKVMKFFLKLMNENSLAGELGKPM
jgi:hypothetical protein